jgi:AcrR family transcriptional regulator
MSDHSTPPRRERFAKADWITIGLAALRDQGPDALTIERLTATAQRTRGSFYHHFASHENFVRAMADSWLQQSTAGPIAEMQQTADQGIAGRICRGARPSAGTADAQAGRNQS